MKRILILILGLSALVSCNKEPGKDDPTPGKDTATVMGTVTGSDGQALENVVVSDGHVCTATDKEGKYYLKSSLKDVDFIFVSTPSGYAAPVKDALPVFYQRFDGLKPDADGKYRNVNFLLTKIANPNRYTIFIGADPQPRSKSAGYDKFGYHSLDCCDDLYRELKETAAKMSSNSIYGIMLGDICHNSTALYPGYKTGMSANGFPTYNVIGNHDHDLSAVGDKPSSAKFEEYFGPVNCSFNLGDIHFVLLDNMMITKNPRSTNSGEDLADGLRDDIWEWLQNDLSYVESSRPLMICVHSPMYMCNGQTIRSRGTITFDGTKVNTHYADVDNLIAKRSGKVYYWAGHTHTMYHYVDVNNPKIESHTVSRSTGELWTNEYNASGTPRGFVIFDYDNGKVKWKFHPIPYQSGAWAGGSKTPEYKYRPWNFTNGKAVMKNGGGDLTESYQMNIYPPGTYAKDDGLVYVDIFMFDELWKTPTFTCNGVTNKMKRVTTSSKYSFYDMGSYEIRDWYYNNCPTLQAEGYAPSKTGIYSMFSASIGNNTHATGTVSVTDRFGNTYTSSVTW